MKINVFKSNKFNNMYAPFLTLEILENLINLGYLK